MLILVTAQCFRSREYGLVQMRCVEAPKFCRDAGFQKLVL